MNTQNDYETKRRKWTDIPRKQVQNHSKEFLINKNNINKKRFLGKATMIITW